MMPMAITNRINRVLHTRVSTSSTRHRPCIADVTVAPTAGINVKSLASLMTAGLAQCEDLAPAAAAARSLVPAAAQCEDLAPTAAAALSLAPTAAVWSSTSKRTLTNVRNSLPT